jgi:uncharacterized membrane protein YgdD (TMEM256/DUF423 family)
MTVEVRRGPAATGAWLCGLAIAGGAFGAHALRGRLDSDHLELWQTAARYLALGGLGTLASALAPASAVGRFASWSLGFGTVVFAATVGAIALGGAPALGAVTPLGGLGMIAGFAALGFGFWARRDP